MAVAGASSAINQRDSHAYQAGATMDDALGRAASVDFDHHRAIDSVAVGAAVAVAEVVVAVVAIVVAEMRPAVDVTSNSAPIDVPLGSIGYRCPMNRMSFRSGPWRPCPIGLIHSDRYCLTIPRRS